MISVQNPIIRDNFNNLDIGVIDSGSLSDQYFRVKDFDITFSLGYNSFKINPLLEKFAPNSEILAYAETERDGKPINISFPNGVDFGNGDLLVSLKIDNSFEQGLIKIQLLGTLIDGQLVLWERLVFLDKKSENDAPLVYKNVPIVNVREVVKIRLLEQFLEGGSSNLFVTQSSFSLTGEDIIFNSGSKINLDVRADGDTFVLSEGFNFTQSMEEGGTIEIEIPDESLPNFLPYYNLTGSNLITASIEEFIANSALKVESVTQKILTLDKNHKYFSFDDANYSIVYPKTIINIEDPAGGTQNFFRFEFINTVPVSGQANSVKIEYKKETEAQNQLLTIAELASNEFLIDTGSLSISFEIGMFDTGSKANTYWETFFIQSGGLIDPDTQTWIQVSGSFRDSDIVLGLGYPEVTIDDVTAFDFTSLLGNSIVVGNDLVDYSGDEAYVELRPVTSSFVNSIGIQKIARYFNFFYRNVDYVLSFSTFTERNLGSGRKDPKMEVYMSGYAFNTIGTEGFGTKLIELESEDTVNENFQTQEIVFRPKTNGVGFPRFIVRSGKWFIKNISIKPYAPEGFNPGHAYIYVPIPSDLVDVSIDFDIDFLNTLNRGVTFFP